MENSTGTYYLSKQQILSRHEKELRMSKQNPAISEVLCSVPTPLCKQTNKTIFPPSLLISNQTKTAKVTDISPSSPLWQKMYYILPISQSGPLKNSLQNIQVRSSCNIQMSVHVNAHIYTALFLLDQKLLSSAGKQHTVHHRAMLIFFPCISQFC